MESQNRLVVGEPRLGWLIDGMDTPDRAVMLRDTGHEIELTVPTKGFFEPDGGHGDWFALDAGTLRIPSPQARLPMPPVLAFRDSLGAVALVGCKPSPGPIGTHGGHGVIRVDYAIFGVDSLDYDRINGLRSELPLLPQWLARRSIRTTWTRGNSQGAGKLDVAVEPLETIPVAHVLNLTLRRGSRVRVPAGPGRTILDDIVEIETNVRRPRPWEAHLRVHRVLMDLLAIAAWRAPGYSQMTALAERDPVQTLDGQARGRAWREAVTKRLEQQSVVDDRPQFLFSFDDIGVEGLRRWIALRRDYSRGLTPILALVPPPSHGLESVVMQACVAIEALGYLMCRNEHGGAHLNAWDQISYAEAARHLIGELVWQPLNDPTEWVEKSRQVYRAVKHADNDLPDLQSVWEVACDALSVVRYWVASRLGCSAESLQRARRLDPLRR